jgi:tRNA pseudouridine32 synthase/23S rRNA pseudouridine746 synthase/23S rRNA pseudouridine1911/1915/1917 synthase
MPPAAHPLTEEEILARLIYRDAMMLVIDKPAGIAVHVTGHDKVAIDQSFKYLQFGLPNPPQLAHRLDRDTSGCLVLGRHRQALIKLGKLFAEQQVEKTYLAIVMGQPAEAEGVIDAAILKSGQGSKWKLSLDPAGQPAVTHYKVLKSNGALSVMEFLPKTGRTHQIRLHAAYGLGCPIVGDPFYGPKEGEWSATVQPMMLHAHSVIVPLNYKKDPIRAEAPVPEAMAALIAGI